MEFSDLVVKAIGIFAVTALGVILFSIRRELGGLFRGLYSNVSITSGIQTDPVTKNSSKESLRYAYALAMLIKVSQSDGGISIAETIAINNVMEGFIKKKGLGFRLHERERDSIVRAVKSSDLDASYYARCIGETTTSEISGLLRIALIVACAEPMNRQKEASVANIAKNLGAPKGIYTALLKEYNAPNQEILTLNKINIGVLSMLVGGKKNMISNETKYLTDRVSGYTCMDIKQNNWVDESFNEGSYIRVIVNARSSVSVLNYYVSRFADFSTSLSMTSKIGILITMKDMAELGGTNKGKLRIIGSVAKSLDVTDQKVAELFANKSRRERLLSKPVNSHLRKCYELLGCDPNDSIKTIKYKYRLLVSEFHPDTLIGKGASERSLNKANDKTREIIEAYGSIRKNHC